MRIRTSFVYPPIPDRRWDWSAVDDETYDGSDESRGRARVIGYGRTEAEAIADLKQQLAEYEVTLDPGPEGFGRHQA